MHTDKHQSFYKLLLSFLMEVTRHIHIVQKRKLVIFLPYIKKKDVVTTFAFYCDAKHSDILRGSSHIRCYLFPGSSVLELILKYKVAEHVSQ